jgi:signal peptidase I
MTMKSDPVCWDGQRYLLFLIPAVVFISLFILFHTVFLIGIVPSSSMEPTFHEGSLILGMRVHGELKTGDVIVFKHDDALLVKRIAACAGDTVSVNDREMTVPEGFFYVLGDNPDESVDSRFWEDPFVSVGDIQAKVLSG